MSYTKKKIPPQKLWEMSKKAEKRQKTPERRLNRSSHNFCGGIFFVGLDMI